MSVGRPRKRRKRGAHGNSKLRHLFQRDLLEIPGVCFILELYSQGSWRLSQRSVTRYNKLKELQGILCARSLDASTRLTDKQNSMVNNRVFAKICLGGCRFRKGKKMVFIPPLPIDNVVALIKHLPTVNVQRILRTRLEAHTTTGSILPALRVLYKKYAGMSAIGLSKCLLVAALVGYFVGKEFPLVRRAEEENVLGKTNVDYMTLSMHGVDVPMDILLEILSFAPSDSDLMFGFGLASHAAFVATLRSWKEIVVNDETLYDISSLVLRSVKTITINSYRIFESLLVKDWIYIFKSTHKNLQRLIVKPNAGYYGVALGKFVRSMWKISKKNKFISLSELSINSDRDWKQTSKLKLPKDFESFADIAPNLKRVAGIPPRFCSGLRRLVYYKNFISSTDAHDPRNIAAYRDFGHTLKHLVIGYAYDKPNVSMQSLFASNFPNLTRLDISFDVDLSKCSFGPTLKTLGIFRGGFTLIPEAISLCRLPALTTIVFRRFPDVPMIRALCANNTVKVLKSAKFVRDRYELQYPFDEFLDLIPSLTECSIAGELEISNGRVSIMGMTKLTSKLWSYRNMDRFKFIHEFNIKCAECWRKLFLLSVSPTEQFECVYDHCRPHKKYSHSVCTISYRRKS